MIFSSYTKMREPHFPLLTKEGQGEVYFIRFALYVNPFLISLYQGRESPLARGRESDALPPVPVDHVPGNP